MEPNPEGLSQKLVEVMSVSAEDWAQTPKSVQDVVIELLRRVQALEGEVGKLREQVGRNSGNSSQPPSSDGPGVEVKKEVEKKHSGRKQGGQAGHPGAQRKLVAVEELKAEYDVKPARCRQCGEELSGEDPTPYRQPVAEVPPRGSRGHRISAAYADLRQVWGCNACGIARRGAARRFWFTATGEGSAVEWALSFE